jgi:hypothetical protein
VGLRPSFRNRVLFVEQQEVSVYDPHVERLHSIQNLIWRTDDPPTKWIEHATERIGDWRSFTRSVYMRWAITINALHVAEARYRDNPNIALTIDTIRPGPAGPQRVHVAVWPAAQAADNYSASIPLIAAYGVQDLYGALEENVFALYEIFLRARPERLMEGPEFKALRKLYRDRDTSDEHRAAFHHAWDERFEAWRRSRAYDGLHRVFANFWTAAGLSRPSWYEHTDIADWCRTIETIGEIRHLIVHGENNVSPRLADLCAAQPALGFNFHAGQRLDVELIHLMIVEHFLDSLLTTINASLLELAVGRPLPMGRPHND